MGDGIELGPSPERRTLTPSSASLDYTQAALEWLLGNVVADGLQVSVADDGRIQATSGQIIFWSSLWQLEAALYATLDSPPTSGEREDKVFLDVWLEEDALVCELCVAPGGLRPSPDPHDYLTLASIHRRAGAGVIAADLHDLRPLVRSQAKVTAALGALEPKLVAAEGALAALQTQLQSLVERVQALEDLQTPPGTVLAFAGQSIPIGYLPCDGRAISRSDHALLYAAIGTTWGAGDGSTTFNLPDLRGSSCAASMKRGCAIPTWQIASPWTGGRLVASAPSRRARQQCHAVVSRSPRPGSTSTRIRRGMVSRDRTRLPPWTVGLVGSTIFRQPTRQKMGFILTRSRAAIARRAR